MTARAAGRELIVVRHGRTTANARGLLLGRTDLPLDEQSRLVLCRRLVREGLLEVLGAS